MTSGGRSASQVLMVFSDACLGMRIWQAVNA